MWLSRCRQWISRKILPGSPEGVMLWSLSFRKVVTLVLAGSALVALLVIAVVSVRAGWEEQQYWQKLQEHDVQFQQIDDRIRPILNQGHWLGITVMPALSAPLPDQGVLGQFADLQFLNHLFHRYQVSDVRIRPLTVEAGGLNTDFEPEPGEEAGLDKDAWRRYELRFHADAINWVAVLSHFSRIPGMDVYQQEWSEAGNAVIRLRLFGALPVSVVGQVSGQGGASQLILKNGQLQRVRESTGTKVGYER